MDDALWSTVRSERLSLADTLATLTPEQWATQSLCSEWTVRDVAAHLAMIPTEPGLSAFNRAWSMGWPFHAKRRMRGYELIAIDADLKVGSGTTVEGRLGDLLLLITGRTAAAIPHLTGPGSTRLTDTHHSRK